MRSLPLVMVSVLGLSACLSPLGGGDDASPSAPAPQAGSGGTQGGSAGGAGMKAGSGGAQAGSAQAGSAQAGSGTAGSATAGSATAGSATAGSGTAGSATAGSATAGSGTAGSATAGSATAGSGTAGSSSGLDPDLEVPPSGEPCMNPGSLNECPGIAVCRISSPDGGTCESCTDCGNLNAFCTSGAECDILFECYKNRCTNFCTLGSTECGPPANCIDVGHATKGVCKPF